MCLYVYRNGASSDPTMVPTVALRRQERVGLPLRTQEQEKVYEFLRNRPDTSTDGGRCDSTVVGRNRGLGVAPKAKDTKIASAVWQRGIQPYGESRRQPPSSGIVARKARRTRRQFAHPAARTGGPCQVRRLLGQGPGAIRRRSWRRRNGGRPIVGRCYVHPRLSDERF